MGTEAEGSGSGGGVVKQLETGTAFPEIGDEPKLWLGQSAAGSL